MDRSRGSDPRSRPSDRLSPPGLVSALDTRGFRPRRSPGRWGPPGHRPPRGSSARRGLQQQPTTRSSGRERVSNDSSNDGKAPSYVRDRKAVNPFQRRPRPNGPEIAARAEMRSHSPGLCRFDLDPRVGNSVRSGRMRAAAHSNRYYSRLKRIPSAARIPIRIGSDRPHRNGSSPAALRGWATRRDSGVLAESEAGDRDGRIE